MAIDKTSLFQIIDNYKSEMTSLSDDIFDHPELGNQEYRSSSLLIERLERAGFQIEKNICNIETAFIATWHYRGGGYTVGLLCEYDALEGIGHACGHQMQGPATLAAAFALQETAGEHPFTVQVFGTPAEETTSAKLPMAAAGIFDHLDVALMMHGSDSTTVDDKSLALNLINFIFTGIEAHAAVAPEKGRSALDALILLFNGVEFLREHVRTDVRMHGIIKEGGVAANIVPGRAVGQFYIRAADRPYLDTVVARVEKVAQGAAMMTETSVELREIKRYDNKVSVPTLNKFLLENAEAAGAPDITPPRSSTGSTDFSSVTYRVPGAAIRVGFVPRGTSSHSQTWIELGKSEKAHQALILSAKIMAGAALDLIENPDKQEELREEFRVKKNS